MAEAAILSAVTGVFMRAVLGFLRRQGRPGERQARLGGFDLHANVVVPGGDRARLERLCRHALRPSTAQDRIRPTAEGRVLLVVSGGPDGATGLDEGRVRRILTVTGRRPALRTAAVGPIDSWPCALSHPGEPARPTPSGPACAAVTRWVW